MLIDVSDAWYDRWGTVLIYYIIALFSPTVASLTDTNHCIVAILAQYQPLYERIVCFFTQYQGINHWIVSSNLMSTIVSFLKLISTILSFLT